MICDNIPIIIILGVTIWNLPNEVGTNLRQKSTIWNEKKSKIQIT